MKLLASLAFGTATLVAMTFGLASPAMADDDVTIGVRLGPLCVGLCIGGGEGGHHRRHHSDAGYEDDFDGGFYAHREDYYHQRYDRRVAYDEAREDGYAGYRRHGSERDGSERRGERRRGDGHRRRHQRDGDDD